MAVSSSHILEQVLRGLAQDWSQLESLDRQVVSLLEDAKEAGEKTFSGNNPADWEAKWQQLRSTLNLMRAHAARTRELLQSSQSLNQTAAPLDEWKEVGLLDSEMEDLLHSLRDESRPAAAAPHRHEWDERWASLESYLQRVRAHVAAVTVKLELHRRFGGEEAGRLTAKVLSSIPVEALPTESAPVQKAAFEVHEEQHECKGFWDVARALLMYWETPDERLKRTEPGQHLPPRPDTPSAVPRLEASP